MKIINKSKRKLKTMLRLTTRKKLFQNFFCLYAINVIACVGFLTDSWGECYADQIELKILEKFET